MSLWQKFLNAQGLRRTVVLLSLVGILYLARSLISIILLTFIFSFLIVRLIRFIQKYVPIKPSIVVIVIYAALIGLIYLGVTLYLPKLITQIEHMVMYGYKFYQHTPKKQANELFKYVNHYVSRSELLKQTKNGLNIFVVSITSLGTMSITLVVSLLLSFFYTIELKQMKLFSDRLMVGPNAWLFRDLAYFGRKFTGTFGVVLEAQFMIALANTCATTIVLACLKMPQLFALSVMIFILSMIPVAGVILSFIPLAFIGYTVGGFKYIIYILMMLVVIHIFEAYILNPKLMSSKTDLPMFYTFVILFVAEKIFGMWGLIVGIPIFTFILEILGVQTSQIRPNLKKFKR